MEDSQTVSNNEAYRSLTNTILHDIDQFKNGVIEDVNLNEKMLINIFSMIRILEQKQDNGNEDAFDEYMPGYKLNQRTNSISAPMNSVMQIDSSSLKPNEESFFKRNEDEYEPSFISNINEVPFTENESRIINFNHDNAQFSLVPNSLFGDIGFNPNTDIMPSSSPFNSSAIKVFSISKKSTTNDSQHEKEREKEKIATPIKSALISKKIEANLSLISDLNNRIVSNSANNTLISTLDISDMKLTNKSTNHIKLTTRLKEKPKQINCKSIEMSEKTKQYYLQHMNENYLICMHDLFSTMKEDSKSKIPLWNDTTQLLFMNTFKRYILSTGICSKHFYEDCLRNLVYQQDNFSFESFLNCFLKLLLCTQREGIAKFKFLLNIIDRENEGYCTQKELESFFALSKCKLVYEGIVDAIGQCLVEKYKAIFPNKSEPNLFNVKQLEAVLETFYGYQ